MPPPMLKTPDDRLVVMTTLRHCYPGYNDTTDVHVEQTDACTDACQIVLVSGMHQTTLTFLDATALDELAEFFANSAQKLRYCTKEST